MNNHAVDSTAPDTQAPDGFSHRDYTTLMSPAPPTAAYAYFNLPSSKGSAVCRATAYSYPPDAVIASPVRGPSGSRQPSRVRSGSDTYALCVHKNENTSIGKPAQASFRRLRSSRLYRVDAAEGRLYIQSSSFNESHFNPRSRGGLGGSSRISSPYTAGPQ